MQAMMISSIADDSITSKLLLVVALSVSVPAGATVAAI